MSSVLNNIRNQHFKTTHIDPFIRVVIRACRDESAHEEAKELVPIAELVQNNLEILDDDNYYHDNLLPLVVEWFSKQFFAWFQAPECEKCSKALQLSGLSRNVENKQVEHYKCCTNNCTYEYTFIRHNEPTILLRTRKGRCGEWAICFMAILRALDYDTRIVFDSTDHVWNEVWSIKEQRWIHVDSCENVVDKPLLYEAGWSKSLQYCIAFSQYEVLDVTPRYTIDFNSTKSMRNQCDEVWLKEYLEQITDDLLRTVPSNERRCIVRERRAKDVDFLQLISLKPQLISDISQLKGRKTGDINWRIQRGEYSPLVKNHHVIKIMPNEFADSEQVGYKALFTLMYDCDGDRYFNTLGNKETKGWSTLTYEHDNLDYKYERDWRTSYIARYESCPYDKMGRISWRFDISELKNQNELIEILIQGQIYPNTSINLVIKGYNANNGDDPLEERELKLNELNTITRDGDLKPETKVLELVATLSGGCENDDVAWQKPQLFRQTHKEAGEGKFSLKVYRPSDGQRAS